MIQPPSTSVIPNALRLLSGERFTSSRISALLLEKSESGKKEPSGTGCACQRERYANRRAGPATTYQRIHSPPLPERQSSCSFHIFMSCMIQ